MTAAAAPPHSELSPAEIAQLAALRRGDENAFVELVAQYQPSLVRIARLYVSDRVTAEEVAQEAWLGVLRGLDRFEGRSSLRTWLFTIVSNLAKTRSQRDKRSVPFSYFENYDRDGDDPAVPAERFNPPDDPYFPLHWKAPPPAWNDDPARAALNSELMDYIHLAVQALPEQQRAVITLRDIEGWNSAEVCNALGLGETNQRVLLHRARSKVRRALEQYFAET